MALDRWVALAFITLCCVYGYAAFFTMDDSLPPILRRNPIWPSTFPKMLTVAGIIVGMMVLFAPRSANSPKPTATSDGTMDITRLRDYQIIPALALVVLMIGYAMTLRPLGFLGSTTLFLMLGAMILGERKFHILIPVSALAAWSIWYLVQEVLGIFLRPWPAFLA
ncbi:tripartite tricarboxylate transporter TctB family protein [uncultured Roseicyclus sp.]|uniref:tripartite tricarboxylate transporter TctB family protein n=1 Tax=uncultured Roseicyclus sp. TaxID=543072 RepID=UPI00261BCEB5|nr:tripartite tricarboxylate transporter TctB family protein [uncultured Roseicyclus sp.]